MTLINPEADFGLNRRSARAWAMGAFNANTTEQIQAIVAAAQAENAPALVQVEVTAPCVFLGNGDALPGIALFSRQIGKVAAEWVGACQFRPAPSIMAIGGDVSWQRLNLGFTSIMFDGSLFPYDENVRLTRRLADMAHEGEGICFEAELGEVPKPGINAPLEGEEGLSTNPDEAAAFVAATRGSICWRWRSGRCTPKNRKARRAGFRAAEGEFGCRGERAAGAARLVRYNPR